ncbi:MAG: hypothetical protein H0U19_12015, partial [Acidobacteria bacterium]|nr:hypothetical protein [Acidobacteriota bacterium]
AFEISAQQSAVDLMLAPDGTHAFIVVSERPAAGAKSTIVPNYKRILKLFEENLRTGTSAHQPIGTSR